MKQIIISTCPFKQEQLYFILYKHHLIISFPFDNNIYFITTIILYFN